MTATTKTATPTRTRTIAGQTLTLRAGARYYASRPFAQRGRHIYPVTIRELQSGWSHLHSPIDVTVNGLTYDQANALVNEFNNGPSSWDGRIW